MDELFSNLGLNTKETKAFLELLGIGASPISRWATRANIHRSSMYVLLERLEKVGLVNRFFHNGIQYVQAIPVSQLPELLERKQRSLSTTQSQLIQSLPKLELLEKNRAITPEVRFFQGLTRVEAMYEEVLKERSFLAIFHPGRVKSLMPAYFHKIPQTLKANGGSAKELLVACDEATEYQKLYESLKHQIKLLPSNITFSSDTIITKSRIFLIGYSQNDAVGTEIWNEELAQTQSVIFDTVWVNN